MIQGTAEQYISQGKNHEKGKQTRRRPVSQVCYMSRCFKPSYTPLNYFELVKEAQNNQFLEVNHACDVTLAILVYQHNEKSAILVYLNNEKSAILVYQINQAGVEHFCNAKIVFCFIKQIWPLVK